MNRVYKRKLSTVFNISLVIYLILIGLVFIWIPDFYTNVLNSQISSLVLILISIYIAIFLITLLISRMTTYEIKNKYIVKETGGSLFRVRSYNFYQKDKIVIERKNSLFKNLLYETRVIVFNQNNKVLDIVTKKDEAVKLSDELTYSFDEVKVPFKKDRDFVYHGINYISILFSPIFISILLFILNGMVIEIFNLRDIAIFGYNMTYTLFSNLVIFGILIILSFYEIIHSSSSRTRINNLNIRSSKGRIYRNHISIPRVALSTILIKYSLPTKLLGISYMNYKYKVISRSDIALHKENINLLIKSDIDEKNKYDPYLFLFFLFNIVFTGGGIALSFFKPFSGIIIAAFSLFYSFRYIFQYADKASNNIIISKYGIINKKFIVNTKDIKKVKIFRYPFKHFHVYFYLNSRRISFFVNEKRLDSIKGMLGYFKK